MHFCSHSGPNHPSAQLRQSASDQCPRGTYVPGPPGPRTQCKSWKARPSGPVPLARYTQCAPTPQAGPRGGRYTSRTVVPKSTCTYHRAEAEPGQLVQQSQVHYKGGRFTERGRRVRDSDRWRFENTTGSQGARGSPCGCQGRAHSSGCPYGLCRNVVVHVSGP